MDAIFSKVVQELKKKLIFDEKKEYFIDFSGQKTKINQENFNFFTINHSEDTSIAFIDGGVVEIFTCQSFSLQFIKIASIKYKNKKRISNNIKDFFVLITKDENKKIKLNFFGKHIENDIISFGESDFTGLNLAEVGNKIMQIAEFNEIKKLSGEIDIVVRDGSFDRIEEQNIDIPENCCAVSKTTNLVTTAGESICFVLNKIQPGINKIWGYSVSDKILFAKLHHKSKYIFRIDVNKEKANKILSILATYSNDPIFLGYPYGLVEADKSARISNNEVNFLRKKFKVLLADDWKNLDLLLSSVNAHDILDNIMF